MAAPSSRTIPDGGCHSWNPLGDCGPILYVMSVLIKIIPQISKTGCPITVDVRYNGNYPIQRQSSYSLGGGTSFLEIIGGIFCARIGWIMVGVTGCARFDYGYDYDYD